MNVSCLNCLKSFNKKPAEVNRTKSNYCSKKCKGDFLSKKTDLMITERVNKNGDCLEWSGALNSSGYGVCRYMKKNMLAHRAAYIIANGDIPDGACVCHKCDNPKCINPDHLFAGSHQENMDDMRLKMRKWSRITFDDVQDIRASSESDLVLSKKYGVSERAIRYAKCATNWMPLPTPPPHN